MGLPAESDNGPLSRGSERERVDHDLRPSFAVYITDCIHKGPKNAGPKNAIGPSTGCKDRHQKTDQKLGRTVSPSMLVLSLPKQKNSLAAQHVTTR